MGLKLRRFHVDIFYPDWFNDSIKEYIKIVSTKRLICSYHATRKYDTFDREYKRAIRDLLFTIKIDEVDLKYIFEFYANSKNEIKKACFRFPMREELNCDIVFVISSTGKVITIIIDKSMENHIIIDKDLYEQGE